MLKYVRALYPNSERNFEDYLVKPILMILIIFSSSGIIVNLISNFPTSVNIKWIGLTLICMLILIDINNKKRIEMYKFLLLMYISVIIVPISIVNSGKYVLLVYLYSLYISLLSFVLLKNYIFLSITIITNFSLVVVFTYIFHNKYYLLFKTYDINYFSIAIVQIIMIFLIVIITMFIIVDNSKINEKRIVELKERDDMTLVFNKNWFNNKLEQLIRRNIPFSILIVDIDDFRILNENHGHYIADDVLVKLSQHLVSSFKGFGTVCRFGGDEFCVFLNDCDSKSINNQLAKILDLDRHNIFEHIDGFPDKVTVSAGFASIQYPEDSISLIIRVNKALKTAKETKNNIHYE